MSTITREPLTGHRAPTTAYAVANWFIEKADEQEQPITHMKLQKLVYLAYGWFYAYFDEPLFDDEILAWHHGPVVSSLYAMFRDCGDRPIDHYAEIYSDADNDGVIETSRYSIRFSDEDRQGMEQASRDARAEEEANIEKILNLVWLNYSHLPTGRLRNMTHRPGSPWQKVYDYFGDQMRLAVIAPEEIRKYFSGLVEQYADQEEALPER